MKVTFLASADSTEMRLSFTPETDTDDTLLDFLVDAKFLREDESNSDATAFCLVERKVR